MVKIETVCRILIWRTFGRIPWHVIPVPLATLQGAVTWRNQRHDHATLQGVIIPSAILKIVFRHILFFRFFKCSLGFDERRLSYRLRYTCLTFNNITTLKYGFADTEGQWKCHYSNNCIRVSIHLPL